MEKKKVFKFEISFGTLINLAAIVVAAITSHMTFTARLTANEKSITTFQRENEKSIALRVVSSCAPVTLSAVIALADLSIAQPASTNATINPMI